MKIKNILSGLFVVLLALLPAVTQAVDEIPFFAGGGTDVGTTLCYAVVSANGKNQGVPVVTYVNATSDKAASVIQFYTITANTAANVVSTTTAIPVTLTNGFASGDIIVIRHLLDDTYERRILTTFTTATNLVVTVAPTVALVVGDIVYRAATAGFIPCGAATQAIAGEGIYAGQPGKPLLLEVDCTSAGQINAVAAKFVNPK